VELKISWQLGRHADGQATTSSTYLTTIASLVSIATPVATVGAILLTGKSSIPVIILAVYFCLLTTAVLVLLTAQEVRHGKVIQAQEVRHGQEMEAKNAEVKTATRYQLAITPLRTAFGCLANASWTVIEGDGSEEAFMRNLEDSLKALAHAYSIITDSPCRVSVKLTEAVDGSPVHDIRVSTLCRSESQVESQADDRISNNTDFRAIVEDDLSYYRCNDLVAELAKGYQNSHWTPQAIGSGAIKYRATIVWPIARARPLGMRNIPQREVIGFLCVDTQSINVFNDTFDPPIGSAFAGVLHLAVHRYRARQMNSTDD